MNRITPPLWSRKPPALSAVWGKLAAWTLVPLSIALVGCGGGEHVEPTAASHTARAAQAASPVTGPGGSPGQPAAAAVPLDHAARTRQGRYLSLAQADELARSLGNRLVSVEARCCGRDTTDLDVLVAFGMQAAADLPADAPFVVSGGDPRQVAAVANRLDLLGAKTVYVVTR